jgi:peroxiredoxin
MPRALIPAPRQPKLRQTFPYALGEDGTRELFDAVGAWWNETRGFIQPTQFLIRHDGTFVQSAVSDGPLGRLEAEDVAGRGAGRLS